MLYILAQYLRIFLRNMKELDDLCYNYWHDGIKNTFFRMERGSDMI